MNVKVHFVKIDACLPEEQERFASEPEFLVMIRHRAMTRVMDMYKDFCEEVTSDHEFDDGQSVSDFTETVEDASKYADELYRNQRLNAKKRSSEETPSLSQFSVMSKGHLQRKKPSRPSCST